MKSQDLADEVDRFIREVQSRIMGTGDEQYSMGEKQKFESMSLPELVEWLDEEIQDVAAYATMLSIRLSRIKKIVSMKALMALSSADIDDHSWGNCAWTELGVCTSNCRERNIIRYVGKDFC